MGITVVPSAVTGQTLSAAQWNTQVRDNINGIWVLTTAGDMLYATGASAAARLALVAGGVMYGGASAPKWLALVTGGVLYGAASAPAWLAPVANGILKGGASAPSWITVGAAHTFLKAEGAGPLYGSPIYQRKGGDATAWGTAGNTTYTPTKMLAQIYVVSVTLSSGVGATAVTFATNYNGVPLVIPGIYNTLTKRCGAYISAKSTSGFTVNAYDVDAESYSVEVMCIVFGE